MTQDEYAAEIRRLAEADGVTAVSSYWDADEWDGDMLDGLTPAEAWAEEKSAREAARGVGKNQTVNV